MISLPNFFFDMIFLLRFFLSCIFICYFVLFFLSILYMYIVYRQSDVLYWSPFAGGAADPAAQRPQQQRLQLGLLWLANGKGDNYYKIIIIFFLV